MPLAKSTVEPIYIGRKPLDKRVKNELEGVAVNSLADVIKQLSSISKHAESLFGDLINEASSIYQRSASLNKRVEVILHKMKRQDNSRSEGGNVDLVPQQHFKSAHLEEQQVLAPTTRPASLQELYQQCLPLPPLHEFNAYRDDGKDGRKILTDPNFFYDYWVQNQKKLLEKQIKKGKKHRKRKSSAPKKKISQVEKRVHIGVDKEFISSERARIKAEQDQTTQQPYQQQQQQKQHFISEPVTSPGYVAPPPANNTGPEENQQLPSKAAEYHYQTPAASSPVPPAPPPPALGGGMSAGPPPPAPPSQGAPPMPTIIPPPQDPARTATPQAITADGDGPPPQLMPATPPPPPPPVYNILEGAPPPPPPAAPPPPSVATPPAGIAPPPPPPTVQSPIPVPVVQDTRSDLLTAIERGMKLRKVEQTDAVKSENYGSDVASILRRRIAIEVSSGEDSSEESSDGEWST